MKFIDLFSGIGGFSLGLERAGMQCVGHVENNLFCQRVLKYHWPHVKLIGDIHDVKADSFGAVGLVCGGYPCQGESICGNQRGAADDRWLWPEMFRVIKIYRPTWVIGENVINHENMGLKMVISDLVSVGYEVRPFIIPNAACGLPTVERHIWIIAAPTCIRLQRGKNIQNQNYRIKGEFSGNDKRENNRWDLPESRVCRTRKGFPDQLDRIKSLGNAVPPQVVEVIGRAIMEAEKKTK